MGSIEYFEKQRRGGRSPGKIDASLNEKLRRVKWGEYKLGELLRLVKTNKINIKKGNCPSKPIGEYILPARTATAQNQGLSCYVPIKNATVIKNKISVSANGDYCAFWHNVNFTILQDSYALEGKNFELNSERALFIISQMNCALRNKYNWANKSGWEKLKNEYIKLPTTNGEIDFTFMETFVAELQFRRMAELEAYLSATGLKDYTLTKEEEIILKKYPEINFSEFPVPDMFDIKNTSNLLSCNITENSGITPYLCASAENNSISTYISYNPQYKEKGNCVFIGGKTFVVTYQKEDFFSNDSHNLALYFKKASCNKLTQLFLATCVKKSLEHKYSWGNSVSKSKIKEDTILLPEKNGEIDLSMANLLISAIQKIVIKNVVLYADKQIAETKKVINKNF